MNQKEFDEALELYYRREPFEPFVIELLDGRTFVVDQKKLAHGGGTAIYGTRTLDLIIFNCEEVREFREAVQEVAS